MDDMSLEVIEQPKALPFLRWKVGRKEKRRAVKPNYAGGRIIGFSTMAVNTEVFHILGFGSTKDSAELMAARRLMQLGET